MKTPGGRLVPRRNQVAAIVEGDAVLINLSNGMYYTTRGIGGAIWAFIEDRYRLEDIASLVAHRYRVSKRKARDDVFGFADQLLKGGLVEPCDCGPEQIGLADAPAGTAYAPPELTGFDDMVEQLALYPPVPHGAPTRQASHRHKAG